MRELGGNQRDLEKLREIMRLMRRERLKVNLEWRRQREMTENISPTFHP